MQNSFILLYLYKTDVGYMGLYFRCIDYITESYIQYFDENFTPTRQGFSDEFNTSGYVYKFKRNNVGLITDVPFQIKSFDFKIDIEIDKERSYEASQFNDQDVTFFTSNGKEYRQSINWKYLPPKFNLNQITN